MTSLSALLAACAVLCAGCVAFGGTPPVETQAKAADPFVAVPSGETTIKRDDGTTEANYRYRLVTPPAAAIADPGATVPLVVFLHGSGERGDDNAAQLKHFAGWCATDAMQSKHPCYVLAMQCPAGETWSPIDLKAFREKGELPSFVAEPTRAMRALMQAIDEVVATKAVDRSRIYLTGLSMGGFGAFDLAARRPAMFAAVVPICGGGDPATAKTVAGIPFCIVHGADDPVVPVALSYAMREAISQARAEIAVDGQDGARGGDGATDRVQRSAPVLMYREYGSVGHDSWTPAYRFGEDGVLDWMFAQRRVAAGG